MSAYRKLPVIIQAEQWHIEAPKGNSEPFCLAVCDCDDRETWHVHTLEGPHPLTDRDWIVIGTEGERYPVKERVFRNCYEPASGGAA